MLSRSLGVPSQQKWAAKHVGHTMKNRETFLQIQQRLLQHFVRKSQILGSLMYQNTHHHT